MRLGSTIPALPARDLAASTRFYVERLGFTLLHGDDAISVLQRDDARIHLWPASDESWHERADLVDRPVRSGAESFIAGTASCRISVDGIDELYAEMAAADVLHGVSQAAPVDTDYGAREFHVVDLDGNLLSFYYWP